VLTITQLGVETDKLYLREFETHAVHLRRKFAGRVLLRTVNLLDPVDVIDAWSNVQSADIVIAHVSADFLYVLDSLTDYQSGRNLVRDEIVNKRSTGAMVILVALSHCSWDEEAAFEGLYPVPNLAGVKKFPGGRDSAWRAVVTEVERTIKHYLRICSRCGTDVPTGFKYCSDCGAEV